MSQKTFTIGITLAGDYDNTVIYKQLAKVRDPQTGCTYLSKKANNVGHALTDTTYWQKDGDPRAAVIEQVSSTATIYPNCLNHWNTAVNGLTITLSGLSNGTADEYMLEFTVDGENFSFNCNNIRWLLEPDFEDGFTYLVSILNGLAIAAGWEAAES